QQLFVKGKRGCLVLHRLDQYLADVVLMTVEQPADRERRIGPELGNHLAGELRMREGFCSLIAQPGDDGYTGIAVYEERIMRVADHPREFRFENAVEQIDHALLVDLGHALLAISIIAFLSERRAARMIRARASIDL